VDHGDLIQIWAKVSLLMNNVYIKNMRIKFIDFVSNDP
ncbi:unnamed protein product, partial [marine sediment metagenome]